MSHEGITDRPSPPVPPRKPQGWTGYETAQVASSAVALGVLGLFIGLTMWRQTPFVSSFAGLALGGLVGALLGVQSVYALRPRGVRVDGRSLPSGAPAARGKPSLPSTAFVPDRAAISFAPAPGLLRPDRLGGHRWAVRGLAVSPIDTVAVSCGDDGMVQAWDLATGFALWGMKAYPSEGRAVAFSPDGTLLAAAGIVEPETQEGGARAVVHVLDARTGLPLRRLEIREDPLSLAFLPGGRRLLVGARGAVRVWELDEPALEGSFSVRDTMGLFALEEPVSLAVDPWGKLAVVGTHTAQEARVVSLPDGEVCARFEGHAERSSWTRRNKVRAVAFSPDGASALSSSNDGTARVWAVRSGAQTCRFDGHAGWWGWHGVTGVAWIPSGEAALSCGEDGTLRRWGTRDGIETACLVHGKSIRCMALSADGRTALTGASDGSIRVWHL